MLPFKLHKYNLSEDSKLRLRAFYENYCTPNIGNGEHLAHLLLACEMAFPMILSARLSNLIWLNFGSFSFKYRTIRAAPVAISDVLFSSLCRPLGSKQYEMVPEIRAYLLLLLFDNTWLEENGVEQFGRTRLLGIAQFLSEYLHKESRPDERQANDFLRLNEWAVMAYLSPKHLTISLAEALKDQFAEGEGGESEQLRLNLIINRFNSQLALKVHYKSKKSEFDFANLTLFSKANKIRLFGGSKREISNAVSHIGDTFLKDQLDQNEFVQLPIIGGDPARIRRKKAGIRRVFTLSVFLDEDVYGYYSGDERVVKIWNRFRSIVSNRKDLELLGDHILRGREANINNFRETLWQLYEMANPEDMVLIYYHNIGEGLQSNSLRFYNESGKIEDYNINTLNDIIKSYNKPGGINLALIIDTLMQPGHLIGSLADVVLTKTAKMKEINRSASLLRELCWVIDATGDLPNYEDLVLLLRFRSEMLENRNRKIGEEINLNSKTAKNRTFLTNKIKERKSNTHLMAYDDSREQWMVVERDLADMTLNSDIQVWEYASSNRLKADGEMFFRDDKIMVGGNFEFLKSDRVYLVSTPERTLMFEIFPISDAPEIQRMENLLFRRVAKGKLNYFAHFEDKKVNLTKGYSIEEDMVTLDLERNQNDEMLLRFYLKQTPFNKEQSLSFETDDTRVIKTTLAKFNQYSYVMRLNPQRYLYNKYGGSVGSFSWANGSIHKFDDANQGHLAIDENSYYIKNGQLFLYPLHIELDLNAYRKVYYNIYLLLPNLTVARLRNVRNEMDKQGENVLRLLTIDLNEYADIILDYPDQVVLKVFTSDHHIDVDLRQDGVNPELMRRFKD